MLAVPLSRQYFRAPTLFATLLGVLFTFDIAFAGLVGRTRVASGLSAPIFATHAPGDRDRLFIAERGTPVGGDQGSSTARIRILNLNSGELEATPFLTIPGIDVAGEGGLLGMAFHPDYATNGKFYVYVTANDDVSGTPFSSYIREYTRSTDPNIANTEFTPILDFTQPQDNHNGGWIGFSPNDHHLYIMTGDGGNGNDQGSGHTEPGGNAQDLTNNLLGKALRIDVNGDDFPDDENRNYAIPASNPFVGETGDDEIWAYGLRNPFRAGFDRVTGDLWIGDVGQNAREEIDFQPGDSPGGENYGWRLREGLIQTPGSVGGPKPADAVDPVWDYQRPGASGSDPDFTGTTVIGGYPYRGPDPELQGLYFFADRGSNRIWTLRLPTDAEPVDVDLINSMIPPDVGSATSPASFGEDALGNLYMLHLSGSVYRITTDALIAGDFNGDGIVDPLDYDVWKGSFGETMGDDDPLAADGNGNGVVDAADYTIWRDNLGASASALGESDSLDRSGVPEPSALLLIGQLVVATALLRYRRCRGRS